MGGTRCARTRMGLGRAACRTLRRMIWARCSSSKARVGARGVSERCRTTISPGVRAAVSYPFYSSYPSNPGFRLPVVVLFDALGPSLLFLFSSSFLSLALLFYSTTRTPVRLSFCARLRFAFVRLSSLPLRMSVVCGLLFHPFGFFI